MNALMSKAQSMMYDFHVLLVDHESHTHAPLIDMFECLSYKVTNVGLTSEALSLLSQSWSKFDLLIENIKSPDKCGYKLLQAAIQLEIPVILLLDEDDVELEKSAKENGVLLCVKKPVSIDTVKLAWQHLLREKKRKENENEPLGGLMAPNRLNERAGEEYLVRSDGTSSDEINKSKTKIDCATTAKQDEAECSFKHSDVYKYRCKLLIEWTEELHEKFMDATRKLGQGRCYPKQILELMNVPGLTRMHVASHLQKCRRGTWQYPKQRKPRTATSKTRSTETKAKRYGSMPILGLGNKSQPTSYIQKNHVNYQTLKNSSIGDNVLGCNIGELAPAENASLDESKAIDEFFEHLDIDSMIQSFCVPEQDQLDCREGWDTIDLDAIFSDQAPIMLETGIEPFNKTSSKPEETKA